MTLATILGTHLRDLREDRGLTKAEMALRLGWHWEVYCRYERGAYVPSLTTLAQVARVHGMTLVDLVYPVLLAWDEEAQR